MCHDTISALVTTIVIEAISNCYANIFPKMQDICKQIQSIRSLVRFRLNRPRKVAGAFSVTKYLLDCGEGFKKQVWSTEVEELLPQLLGKTDIPFIEPGVNGCNLLQVSLNLSLQKREYG